ncbi:MAG: tRNA dihydrouridine synthase [Akkermansiaceae bacterium]
MFTDHLRGASKGPILALAPMQDVTDLAFMRVMSEYGGGPDYFVTEYFRVHPDSAPEKKILRSITHNETGRPIYAQMIGVDVGSLVRTSEILLDYDIAGMDINLGCPAPTVCRKDAGGGLLRNLDQVDRILGAMREVCSARGKEFTVKTRIGYEDAGEFEKILDVFVKHEIDALAIHGRTVRDKYQTPVRDEFVKAAVERMGCPVMANGNVVNVATGRAYHEKTGAAGLMVGRGAIRSPWIFQQLRASYSEGGEVVVPSRRDLHQYVTLLFAELAVEWVGFDEAKHVNKMKKYMIYIAQGLDEAFEYEIRRVRSEKDFFRVCDHYLLNDEVLPDLPPERSKLFCGFKALLD